MSNKTKQKTDEMVGNWRLAVNQVVNGSWERFQDRAMDVTPNRLKEFFEMLGWDHVEPEEGGALVTNGWQWDWWMDFRKGKRTLTAAGSGYYGGFALHPKEEA